MKTEVEKLREEFRRDTYWTRINISSDDDSKKTTVLVCASHEYLWDLFEAREIEQVKFDVWLDKVVKKWEAMKEEVFNAPVHYDVYANTKEGMENGDKFLKEEVKP